MIYNIYRNNLLVASVKPLDTSELSQKKQTEDVVRLNFILTDYVTFEIGDYIALQKTGQLYRLNKKPRVVENPRNYQYECIFEGSIHELSKSKVLLQTAKTGGGYYIDYKFSLTGNAQTFLLFIVDNLNRTGTGYTVGTYKVTSTKTIQFNNWNAYEAIQEISSQLGFGWYINGKEINFDDRAFQTSYIFQTGRKLGFTQLIRSRIDSETRETVVYGYGSTQNLPPRVAEEGVTYDSELLMENRLCFDGVDGLSKLEKNVDKYGVIECIQEFDIKPERIGNITSVVSEDVRAFFDSAIDFDINEYLMAGIKPKVVFLTGKLIGFTFDFSFDSITGKITLDYYSDESGQYPNEVIKAEVGDTYTFLDLIMPNEYIEAAKTELQQATQTYLDRQSGDLDVYEGSIDEEYIQSNSINLFLGDVIRIVSPTFLIDNLYEINELVQNINNGNQYTIKFGEVLPKSLLALLRSGNFNVKQQIYNVERTVITNNEITNVLGQDLAWQSL